MARLLTPLTVFRNLAIFLALATFAVWGTPTFAADATSSSDYVIVVSSSTSQDSEWSQVVAELKQKRAAAVLIWENRLSEVQAKLREKFPKYICFVARPEEAGRDFIAAIYDLTVSLDDDPYLDVFWAVLTGYDAENALEIVRETEPLVIRKVAGGTEFATEMVEEGQWFDELVKNKHIVKKPGEKPVQQQGPDDTVEALVALLNDYRPDLWITSGHATEHDWAPGFRFACGRFVHKNGVLYGLSLKKETFAVDSPNPKIYMPIGNCLAGHIDGRDCMATSYMKSAGVRQCCGYTVPTWFGYAGWGCLDYFVEQPGRYSFIEACFANQQALRFEKIETQNKRGEILLQGLESDEKVLAIYGDPAWIATTAPQPLAWEQNLVATEDGFSLEIKPNRGAKTFEPINLNGSQRGGRPIIQWLPFRVGEIEIVAGAELRPIVADNFILIPHSSCQGKTEPFRVEFKAKKL